MKANQIKPIINQKTSFWLDDDFPIAIAHRGGGAAYGLDRFKKENTIEAFAAAIGLGYRYLELDVIASADNQVIVIHVAKSRPEAAKQLKDAPNSRQLQKLTYDQIKVRMGREAPLLADILTQFPGSKLMIDAKTDEVVEPLADVIRRFKAFDNVCLGSFFPHRILKLRRLLGGQVNLELNISRSPWHFARQWLKLRSSGFREEAKIIAVHWPKLAVSKKVVNKMHEWGIKVLVWVPNDEKSIKKALAAGADGIISDNIQLLKSTLEI